MYKHVHKNVFKHVCNPSLTSWIFELQIIFIDWVMQFGGTWGVVVIQNMASDVTWGWEGANRDVVIYELPFYKSARQASPANPETSTILLSLISFDINNIFGEMTYHQSFIVSLFFHWPGIQFDLLFFSRYINGLLINTDMIALNKYNTKMRG